MSDDYKGIIKKIVERDPKRLKFDPDQPRKKFNEEIIENIAKTYETQEIINEPEIDENDMIITGELRVRGAIKKGLSKIKCKLLVKLSKEDRFERQVIENLHHNILSSIEKEDAITELWNSERYKTKRQLANTIGVSDSVISDYLKAKKLREKLKVSFNETFLNKEISTITLIRIAGLNNDDQLKMIAKISKGDIRTGEIQKITKIIKQLPEDVKTEYLKINSPLDIEKAEIVAQYPEEEQRKEVMKSIKLSKDSLDYLLQYELEVAKGGIPKQIKLYDVDREKFGLFQRISLRLMSRMNISFLEDLSQDVKYMCYDLMRQIAEHLNRELEKIEDSGYRFNKIIEVKMEDENEA